MHGFQMLLLCVNMAALTTAVVMRSMKLTATAVTLCVGSAVLILGVNIRYSSIPGILFLTLKGSTILSHVPTLKFRVDGELYNLRSHSSPRPGLFI